MRWAGLPDLEPLLAAPVGAKVVLEGRADLGLHRQWGAAAAVVPAVGPPLGLVGVSTGRSAGLRTFRPAAAREATSVGGSGDLWSPARLLPPDASH